MHILRFLIFSFFLLGCLENTPLLDKIKNDGELIVVTRNSPTTYYTIASGPTGFEYDLVSMFADYLGVKIKIVVPNRFSEIIPMIANGEAHLAAAGLTVTESRKQKIRFGPAYQQITQQVVYNRYDKKPSKIENLSDGILEVVGGSSHVERLKELHRQHPELSWNENFKLSSEELITLVKDQLVHFTIADSNEVAVNQRFYPQIKVAMDITKPQPLAWAFSYKHDFSLYDAALEFFEKIKKNGDLETLIERYYGHVENVGHIGRRTFLCYFKDRFPLYEDVFKQEAQKNGLDWRLLAAIGYQESLWNPDAVSPTGVKGIMMLTRQTSKLLGVKTRTNPVQSIQGGAKYFAKLHNIIPDDIIEPDRTWFALAAYNVGLGHLDDARKITTKLGNNPNKWMDVRESLPLLKKKSWFKKARYGYARGDEPVNYVERIRSFYDILIWVTENEAQLNDKTIEALLIDPIAL